MKFLVNLLLSLLFLICQVAAGRVAGPFEALATESPQTLGGTCASGASSTLAPFYLFRDCGSRGWWERVQIIFIAPGDLQLKEEQMVQLRRSIFESLKSDHKAEEQEKLVRNAISRALGAEMRIHVHLQRCYLLLP